MDTLPNLSVLDLACNDITPVGLNHLLQLYKRNFVLFIVGNRISDVGLENLCKVLDTLPNLSVLDLACNDITPVGLNHLCAMVTSPEHAALQVSSEYKKKLKGMVAHLVVCLMTIEADPRSGP